MSVIFKVFAHGFGEWLYVETRYIVYVNNTCICKGSLTSRAAFKKAMKTYTLAKWLLKKGRKGRLLLFNPGVFADFFKVLGVFTQNLRDIVACGVRFKEVACVEFSACSASAADFSVFANSASALDVALVP